MADDKPLQVVSREHGKSISTYVDEKTLPQVTRISLPNAELSLPRVQKEISEAQLALISNQLNRALCDRLGDYFPLVEDVDPQSLRLEFRLTGITPTSKAISGVSAALGVFVPGPFRLPVGMGAIALDGESWLDDRTVTFLRWAKGANPVFNGAKVSTIGDAYDLVDSFARDFTALLVQPPGDGPRRSKLDQSQIEKNELLCLKNFGEVGLAGKGASFLLPLSPESVDQGKPIADPGPAKVP
ncbi:MAG: DUF3313 family protein [Gammaproteobacteria bacterium]|nr:DUF3313 family protein [Gammaproteobacteria bacterium]